MKITYDAAVNAAYIQLADEILPGAVDRTYLCDPNDVGGIVDLDLDASGRIVGIEVSTASALLPAVVLRDQEASGRNHLRALPGQFILLLVSSSGENPSLTPERSTRQHARHQR